ncbi:myeloid-associated differentiation marker [Camelus ferus]|uniref:Myeloid-associated differentiation marker n=1 Tax=Camelus ferus TaxID=419612 RepID=A0A8B8S3G9_CAMFR|nr:myeloid-associated differentiation marker [Camelus ferus]
MDVETFCLCFFRLMQLLSTCVPFSLMASMGTGSVVVGNWSMFIWGFCFTVTLVILIVEFCHIRDHLPFSWYGFLTIHACYATLFCLLTSILYPTTYIEFFPSGPHRDYAMISTTFSCIALVLYALELLVLWNWYQGKGGRIARYMYTTQGLLKLLETSLACVIFGFISNTNLYLHQPALVWCGAVYSICFVLSSVAILLNLGKCDNRLLIPLPTFLLGLTMLSILLYTSALVLWPLYQFVEKLGGQPQRSSDVSCGDRLTYLVCTWDQGLAVTILTVINLLIYMADLVTLARLVFVRIEDQPTDRWLGHNSMEDARATMELYRISRRIREQ